MLTHPAFFLRSIYPSLVWDIKTEEAVLYLTFDDGPTPGVSDVLLDLLDQFNAKATFFCVGNNIAKYPELYKRILSEGHEVGNHTFSHKNGWVSNNLEYIKDVRSFQEYHTTQFFRPPYGRLKPAQIQALKHDYKIIMWSALSMDYHSRVSKEECYQNANKKLKGGDIIVFHDSLKAKEKMLYAVERILRERTEQGFSFRSLSQ